MPSILTLVAVSLLAVISGYLYWKRCRYWAERLPKNVTRSGVPYPIIGNSYQMFLATKYGLLKRGLEIIRDIGMDKDLKKVIFWLGELPGMMLTKPEDIEVLLGSTREIFKSNIMYKPAISFFGNGLITLNGETWQHHRKVLTPVFHFKILERYVEVFERYAADLVQDLLDPQVIGKEIDVLPKMCRVVSHTITETAFGMNSLLKSPEEKKRRDVFLAATDVAFKIIEERVIKPWLMADMLFRLSPLYYKQKKAEKIINDYALRIIRLKREEIASETLQSCDQTQDDDIGAKRKVAFLDLVLRDSKNLLSEDEILQEVRTLVTVQQTTATTLSFIFLMLAIHQDVQDRVYEEICQQDYDTSHRSTYERLSELKYLDRVIKETMRLYPVTPIFSRLLKEDLPLSDCTIPSGTTVVSFLYLTHRDRRFYGPDPDRFNPDHFLPEQCRTRHPYAYIPFSAGARNCIGQRYAIQQMKAIVSTVVKNLRIYTGKGCRSQEELNIEMDTFLHVVGGFHVRFEPRV